MLNLIHKYYWPMVVFPTTVVIAIAWHMQTEREHEEKLRIAAEMLLECAGNRQGLGEKLFECAEDLDELEGQCGDVALEYVKRGNLLLDCEQSMCKTNGWDPPVGWDPDKLRRPIPGSKEE